MVRKEENYVGLYDDYCGGMTPTGAVIKDAWLFGILPETEDCKGWSRQRLQEIYDKVYAAWEPYGHLASRLPEELRVKHAKIHDEAIARARSHGWDPELGEDD